MSGRFRGWFRGSRPGWIVGLCLLGNPPARGDDPPETPARADQPQELGSTRPMPSVRNPNDEARAPVKLTQGWELLSHAAEMMVGLGPDMPPHQGMSRERLQALMAPNREALPWARRGLVLLSGRDGNEAEGELAPASAQRVTVMKALARLFLAEELRAERMQQNDAAMTAALDLVRLGCLGSRGGLVNDHHVGQTTAALGRQALQRLQPGLTAVQCKAASLCLFRADAAAEPFPSAWARDPQYATNAQSWGVRWRRTFLPARLRVGPGHLEQQYRFMAQRESARLRLLIVDLAVRAYDLERKTLPKRLEDLTPEYLPSVPEDPFRAAPGPLTYRLVNNGAGYRLYALGANQVDDDGHPQDPNSPQADGDIVLSPIPGP